MTCVDSSNNKPAGTSCGASMVCNANGMCGACTPNQSCTTNPDPCFTGITSCNSGTMVCNNDTAKAVGASCGSNMVCNSAGACVACTAGMACTTNPNPDCKNGTISCTTGAPICVDGGNKPNGTSCGAGPSCVDGIVTSDVCKAGACGPDVQPCDSGMCFDGLTCALSTSATSQP